MKSMWNLFRASFDRTHQDSGSDVLRRAVEEHKIKSENIMDKIQEGKSASKYQLDLANEALAIADRINTRARQ